jgi:glutamate-ammonia-ligase adenylyltransferase
MKALIAQQAPADHLKLGHGGIREIEFIVQSQQLVRGGRLPSLCTVSLLQALAVLQEIRALPAEDVRRLRESYAFLRRLEHRLQIWNDEQTHRFPADALIRQRLAVAMGFNRGEELTAALQAHQRGVQHCFQRLFVPAAGAVDSPLGATLWTHPDAAESALWTAPMRQALNTFHHSRRVGGLAVQARERLDRLMPLLLAQLTTEASHPEPCLLRLLLVIEAIIRRSAYLALLIENPGALKQLVCFCDVSEWFSTHIARYPVVLDQLLDPQALYAPINLNSLTAEWQAQKTLCNDADMEGQMDALRQFRQAQVLRIAAAEVSGRLDTTAVSQALSQLAEVILDQVLRQSWHALSQKHGAFSTTADLPFAVIAYGKLGSGELAYQSDLDLVFLYPQSLAKQTTQGENPLDGTVFFPAWGNASFGC